MIGVMGSLLPSLPLAGRVFGAPCVDLAFGPQQRAAHLLGLREALKASGEGVHRLDLDAKPGRGVVGAQESLDIHSDYDTRGSLFTVTVNRSAMETFRCGHPKTPENVAPNGKNVICRECRNARRRENYAADLEASREANKERMRKHRGGVKGNANARKDACAQGHPYDDENTYLYKGNRQCKTCRKQRVTETWARHGERYAASHREWYQQNRDKAIAATKRWSEANPERVALTSRLKKQRRRAAGVLTAAEWRLILALHGHRCLSCGCDGPLTIDHVIPVSKGGPNTAANVQPLCGPCNSSKATKTIDYRPTLAAV